MLVQRYKIFLEILSSEGFYFKIVVKTHKAPFSFAMVPPKGTSQAYLGLSISTYLICAKVQLIS